MGHSGEYVGKFKVVRFDADTYTKGLFFVTTVLVGTARKGEVTVFLSSSRRWIS